MRGYALRAGVLGAILMVAGGARAQPSGADRALATELFDQGRALVTAGQYSEACPKFAESQRLDPSAGTLLNLANCHELEGKTATAWSEFNEAFAVAEREGQAERVEFARAHITELAPRLSRLVIRVPSEVDRSGDFELTRDGTLITRVSLGSAMPIDPGSHRVGLTARGYAPWSATFEIMSGERRELLVGPLVPVAEPASVSPPPVPAESSPRVDVAPRSNLPWIVGGGGAVAIGIGAAFGVLALTKSTRSEELCNPRCNEEGYTLNQDARTAADVSTASFIVGAVAVGVGVFLYVTSPRRTKSVLDRRNFRF